MDVRINRADIPTAANSTKYSPLAPTHIEIILTGRRMDKSHHAKKTSGPHFIRTGEWHMGCVKARALRREVGDNRALSQPN